jgi:2-polyprenyl-3-methyl-5-hydroxy-6-metoxy-1,4-benzoquinol methylase
MIEKITFSFGKNWRKFSKEIDKDSINSSRIDILKYLEEDDIKGKSVIDIGCGSGIHSLAMLGLGASNIFSFDYDPISVETAKNVKSLFAPEKKWIIEHGSILDVNYFSKFRKYDIVYSWGVLHHTGDMWSAINNASKLVEDSGFLFLSIYAKGPNYSSHLELKERYNKGSKIIKNALIYSEIIKIMVKRIRKRKNPFNWNQKLERGMTRYHDIVDWLGGLPYEVATIEELKNFLEERKFELVKFLERPESTCHRLLFRKNL